LVELIESLNLQAPSRSRCWPRR